jgi:hypothetical protein
MYSFCCATAWPLIDVDSTAFNPNDARFSSMVSSLGMAKSLSNLASALAVRFSSGTNRRSFSAADSTPPHVEPRYPRGSAISAQLLHLAGLLAND